MVTRLLRTDNSKDFYKMVQELRLLADAEVLAGFPAATTDRSIDPDAPQNEMTNAALAYIHDNGAPEVNIPARPFMYPAMDESRDKVGNKLGQVLKAVVDGRDSSVVEQGMHQVGLIVQLAIQNKINEGIPPPLAEATLRKRAARGRKGAQQELDNRKAGLPASTTLAKTLVDSGEMRKSANYAIRSRKAR